MAKPQAKAKEPEFIPGTAVVRTPDNSGINPAVREFLQDVQMPNIKAFATRDISDLWMIARQCLGVEIKAKIAAGIALRQLRDQLPSQGFSEGLRQIGAARSTAYESIDCADVFDEFPNLEVVRAVAGLGFSKVIAMKRLPATERLALASGQEVRGLRLDTAIEMTSREFVQATRDPELVKAQKKIDGLQADKEGLQSELKDAQGALRHRYETLKMPDFAAHARQESVALAEQMSISVTSIEELLQERLVDDKEAKLYPEWVERAAGTVYHSIRSVHARTQMLLERMEETYGPAVTGKVDYEHSLSPGELLIARDALSVILKRHKAEAENREADRANAKGGRGRPRAKQRVD